MFKKLTFIFFLFLIAIGFYYPLKKENIETFNYCYSLEKLLLRNSFKRSEKASEKVKSISKNIAKFGISKTKGKLISQMINRYKTSKNSFIINLAPNEIYCLAGYWIEQLKPGTFESVLYLKGQESIDEFTELKDEVDKLIKNINSEYKDIKEEFNKFL